MLDPLPESIILHLVLASSPLLQSLTSSTLQQHLACATQKFPSAPMSWIATNRTRHSARVPGEVPLARAEMGAAITKDWDSERFFVLGIYPVQSPLFSQHPSCSPVDHAMHTINRIPIRGNVR